MNKRQHKRREKRARHNTQNAPQHGVLREHEGAHIESTKQPDKGDTASRDNEKSSWYALFGKWARRNSPSVVAAFTIILAVIGTIQALIYSKQLAYMQADQRAWVKLTSDISRDIAIGQPIKATVTINNIGKTSAVKVWSATVIKVVHNQVHPAFDYDNAFNRFDTGVLFPNDPFTFPASSVKNTSGQPTMSNLSASDHANLMDGEAYVMVYSKTIYNDIFGAGHILLTCNWRGYKDGQFTSDDCTKYNNMRDEERQ